MTLRITLPSESQFRHLQNKLLPVFGKLFVKPCGDNGASLDFDVTFQNPISPDWILSGLQSLAFNNGQRLCEADIKVVGLELALDLYARSADNSTLLTIAALHMCVHHAHPLGSLRITKPKHFFVPATKRDTFQELDAGYTAHTGEDGGDHTTRHYVKRHDTMDGVPHAALAATQHRARFENTWRGNHTPPFKTLDEWRNFRFESLAQQFALVKPTATIGMAALLQGRIHQLGRPLNRGVDEPHHPDAMAKSQLSNYRRKRAAGTQRDTPTNEKIQQALRNLTQTQARIIRENSGDFFNGQAYRLEENVKKTSVLLFTLMPTLQPAPAAVLVQVASAPAVPLAPLPASASASAPAVLPAPLPASALALALASTALTAPTAQAKSDPTQPSQSDNTSPAVVQANTAQHGSLINKGTTRQVSVSFEESDLTP